MIGRFASRLGKRHPGHRIAGVILTLLGVWFATDPLRHDYPEANDLVAIEAEATGAVEIRKRRGAFLRFLTPDPLEVQAVLDPGKKRSCAISITCRVTANSRAPLDRDPRHSISGKTLPIRTTRRLYGSSKQLERPLVSVEETVRALKNARSDAAWLPGGIALFGLAIVVLTLWRRA